jgi:hypothetical protein
MGLKPIEFYSISPKEFELMVEGFKNRQLTNFRLNRNILFIMARLWSDKAPKTPKELWDLGDEEETNEDEIAKLFEALKEKNG